MYKSYSEPQLAGKLGTVKSYAKKCLQPLVNGHPTAMKVDLYCIPGYPDLHLFSNQVVGNGIFAVTV